MQITPPRHQRLPQLCWLASVLLGLLFGATPLRAAPPEQWEVMRVFIRDQPDQISRLVTRHYATVLLDDLSRELAEQDNLRKIAALQAPSLQEALYVARLEGELLVSDQSRWQLSGNELAQPLELGNISLALRAARGLSGGQSQLLDRVQFTSTGAVELQPWPATNQHWFGFSVSSQSSAKQRLFAVQVPPAPNAKLLVSTAASVELNSPTLVVQKIASPQSELPEGWPESWSQPSAGATQWWLVHLSGVSRFELLANERSGANLTAYQHLVRSATIEYTGSDSQLSVQARFVVAGSPDQLPLRVRASSKFKIESVVVGDQAVEWHVLPSQAAETNLLELMNLPASTQDRTLRISASSSIDLSGDVSLPTLELADSYTIEGLCRLSGKDDIVADRLQAAEATVERVSRTGNANATDNPPTTTEPLWWQTRWLGNPPEMHATFSRLRHPWNARSLTRLSLQAEWLSANCRMRLESAQLTSNEIRLTVGSGWFIDAVRLIQTGSDFRARVEDRKEAASPVIVIHWDDDRSQVALELEVVAHSPLEPSADTVNLQIPRLVSLPQADQIDNYVIEPSNRFAVQMGAELLTYQRSAIDLPAWQQQLLPEQPEHWIFQPVRGAVPTITLTSSSGTFTSQVITSVRQQAAQLNVDTRIQFVPTGGAIDHVNLLLPPRLAAQYPRWTLQQTDADATVLLDPSSVAAEPSPMQSPTPPEIALASEPDSQVERLIELELPNAISGPFTLLSQVEIPLLTGDSQMVVPIVGVPQATTIDSLVLVPKELAAQLQGAVELLPVLPDLGEGPGLDLRGGPSDPIGSTWIAARIEPGAPPLLQVRHNATSKHPSWAWNQWLQHSLLDNGQMRHDVQWSIEATRQEPIEILIPQGWQVEQVSIDGEPVVNSSKASRVLLDLPRASRAQVSMRCTSRQAAPGWLSYTPLPRPQLSLPILESQQTLLMPPSRASFPSFPLPSSASNAKQRLVDRLLPSAAWNLLAPTRFAELTGPGMPSAPLPAMQTHAFVGWQRLEIPNLGEAATATSGVWTVSRTGLAALCLAFVLLAAAFFWVVIGAAIRTWWLMLAACAVTLILAPIWLLPLMQLLSLSLAMAALLRMGYVVCRLRDSGPTVRGRSSVVSGLQPSTTASLLLLVCLGNAASAQSDSPSRNALATATTPGVQNPAIDRPTGTTGTGTNREIFSVLIPIDEAGEVSGSYAYAPTRLLELLARGVESTSRTETPRILSADYTLRMRRSLLGQPDQLQELAVEFRLQVTQAEVEIRLPFNSNQLLLQRGSAGGQELFVGGRGLYQVGDAVVFRPSNVGSVRLQLQFEARSITQTNNQANLNCAIPPIPNATLRIVADSNSSFEVRAAGAGRKSLAPGSTDLLGPVEAIDLQWSLNKPRSTVGQPAAEVSADTWLHVRGNQLVAICQLRIDQARSLPRELHLVAEPGWEPVGVHWQDGELIGNELSSLGGRRVYTLRCGDEWESLPRRVFRVMMVPRANELASDAANGALTIPFFTMREVSQQAVTRTLAWSAEADAVWRPEGLDFWQELANVPGLEWGNLGWGGQPRLYRIVNTLSASLRRVPSAAASRVEEITEVHLGPHESKIEYRAQLAVPSKRVLSLLIPANARVDAVRVDGNVPDYRVTERAEQALIELIPTDSANRARTIEVELSQPIELQQATHIPRVVLRDMEAASSVVRILRAAGLDCQVDSTPTLGLQTASLPPHELLPQLESPVGQVELRNAYRDTPWLPLKFNIQSRPQPPLLGAIMTLQPAEQGWQAKVRATWETGSQPLDYAFFDLPAAVRDSIDTNKLAAQLVPHGDASRVTLRLLPPAPVAGLTVVEFSFLLPNAGSTQAISIPQLSVVADLPLRPVLGLPEQLNGQAIQWAQTGRRLEDVPDQLLADGVRQAFQFYELETSQAQVSWKRFEEAPRNSRLLLTRATLLKQEQQWISGFIDYWVQPSGQLELELALAESCDILGVEIGGKPAIWQRDAQKLSILLQPNFLPVNVRVLLHWRLPDPQLLSLALPEVLNATPQSDTWRTVDNQLPDLRVKLQPPLISNAEPGFEFPQRWATLLAENWSTANSRPAQQTLVWLLQWHPQQLGLDDTTPVESFLSSEQWLALELAPSDEPRNMSVSELWQQLWAQASQRQTAAKLPSATLPSNAGTRGASQRRSAAKDSTPDALLGQLTQRKPPWVGRPSRQLLTLEEPLRAGEPPLTLLLEVPPTTSSWSAQVIAAGLLAFAALLVQFLATRVSTPYLRLLNYHPWLYWLQLAGLAWFLLPMSWPSWVLALTAITMFVSQSIETRRRHRLLARV